LPLSLAQALKKQEESAAAVVTAQNWNQSKFALISVADLRTRIYLFHLFSATKLKYSTRRKKYKTELKDLKSENERLRTLLNKVSAILIFRMASTQNQDTPTASLPRHERYENAWANCKRLSLFSLEG
jgi:hypothetical protein